MRSLEEYIRMALAWRATTPAEVMGDDEIARETLAVAEREGYSRSRSEAAGMAVRSDLIYGWKKGDER